MKDLRMERAQRGDLEMIVYLEKDVVRNSLDIWNLQHNDEMYELYVSRVGSDVKTHLGIYSTPEAVYVSLGGESSEAESLLPLVPHKVVLTADPKFRDLVTRMLKCDTIYPTT